MVINKGVSPVGGDEGEIFRGSSGDDFVARAVTWISDLLNNPTKTYRVMYYRVLPI